MKNSIFKIVAIVAISISPLVTHSGVNDGAATTQSNQQAANQTSKGAGSAGAMNMVMGAAMMIPCVMPPPGGPNIMACVMAAQSFMQAKEDGKAKKVANASRAGFNSDLGNPDNDQYTNPNDEFGPFTRDLGNLGIKDELGLYRAAQQNLDDLTKRGITYDPETNMFTTPDGKKYSPSSFASTKSMLDAGMPKDQVDAAMDVVKKINDKYKAVAIGLAGGGGGGGGGGSSGSKSSSSNYDPYASLFGNNKEKPNDPKTTGLSRKLASGESIGTQTDSIFEMISRTYKRKTAENIFVKSTPNN